MGNAMGKRIRQALSTVLAAALVLTLAPMGAQAATTAGTTSVTVSTPVDVPSEGYVTELADQNGSGVHIFGAFTKEAQLFATDLRASGSAAYTAMLQAAATMAIDRAWQLDIANGTLADVPDLAYAQDAVLFPVSPEVAAAADAGRTLRIIAVVNGRLEVRTYERVGAQAVDGTFSYANTLDADDALTVRPVEGGAEAVFSTEFSSAQIGAFALAYVPAPAADRTFTVTVRMVGQGSGSHSPAAASTTYAQGATPRYAFFPDEGGRLASLEVTRTANGQPYDASKYAQGQASVAFLGLDADVTIVATFDQVQTDPARTHTIRVMQTGEVGGQAALRYAQAPDGELVAVGPQAGEIAVDDALHGAAAYLALSPAAGCTVEGVWVYGAGGAASDDTLLAQGATSVVIPAITEDVTVEVRYAQGYVPPVVTHTVWGVVEGDASAGSFSGMDAVEGQPGRFSITTEEGAFQAFTVNADVARGWRVSHVEVCAGTPDDTDAGRVVFDSPEAPVASFAHILSAVTQDTTVRAQFVREMVSVVFPADIPGGSVVVRGPNGDTIEPVDQDGQKAYPIGVGDEVRLTFTPDEGYVLSGVLVNGVLVVPDADGTMGPLTRNPDGSYTFVPDGRTQVTPVFSPTDAPKPDRWAQVEVSTDGRGRVVPVGAVTIERTGSLTLNLMADEGLHPDKVRVTPAGHATTELDLEGAWTWEFDATDYDEAARYYVHVTFADESQGGTGPTGPEQPTDDERSTITIATTAGGTVFPAGAIGEDGVMRYTVNPGRHSFTLVPDAASSLACVMVTEYASDGTAHMVDVSTDTAYLNGATLSLMAERGRPYRIFAQFKHDATDPDEQPVAGKYAVSAQAEGPGAVAPSGTTAVSAGVMQAFSFIPYPAEDGFENRLVSVKLFAADASGTPQGDGRELIGAVDAGTLLLAVNAPLALRATFACVELSEGEQPTEPTATVRVAGQAGRGGSVSPQGTQTVIAGAPVTFTFTEQNGYRLAGMDVLARAADANEFTLVRTLDMASLAGISPSYAYTLPADLTAAYAGGDIIVRGTFEAVASTRTVTVASAGPGSVSPAGNVVVAAGESQTFYFYPDAPTSADRTPYVEGVWVGGSWDGTTHVGGRKVADEVTSYELSGIDADTLLFVKFSERAGAPADPDPIFHTIQASASEGGTLSPAGTTQVREGGTLLYTALPDAGWRVKDVSVSVREGDDWSASASVASDMVGATYRFQALGADARIHADFERIAGEVDPGSDDTYVMQLESSGPGRVSPSGSIIMTKGAGASITLLPDSDEVRLGSVVADVVFDGQTRTIQLAPDALRAVQEAGWLLSTDAITSAAGNADAQIQRIHVAFAAGVPDVPAPPADDERYVDITSDAAPGGTIVPASMRALVGQGASKNAYIFAVVSDKGYHVDGTLVAQVTRDGAVVDAAANGVALTNNGNGTYLLTLESAAAGASVRLSASFLPDVVAPVPDRHTVKIVVEGEGAVSPAGDPREGESATYLTVAHGATQTFTFIPRTEGGITWPLEYIQVSTASVPGQPLTRVGASYALHNISTDMVLYAKFATYDPDAEDGNLGGVPSEGQPTPSLHTVSAAVAPTGGGTIAPKGQMQVADGATLSFLLTPDSGYRIDFIALFDGTSALGRPTYIDASELQGGLYTMGAVHGDATVIAHFAKEQGAGEEVPARPYADIRVDVQAAGVNAFGDTVGGSVSPISARVVRGGSQRFIMKPADGSYVASVTCTMGGVVRPCELCEIPLPGHAARATDHQAPYSYVVIDDITADAVLSVTFGACEDDPANPGGPDDPYRYVYDEAAGTVVDTTPGTSGGVQVEYPDNTPDAIPGIDQDKTVIVSPDEGKEIEKITLGDKVVEILDTDGDGKIDKVIISDADGGNRVEIEIVPPGDADAVQDALDEFNKKVSEELGYKPGDDGYDTKWVIANKDAEGNLDGTYTVTVPVVDAQGRPVDPSWSVEAGDGSGSTPDDPDGPDDPTKPGNPDDPNDPDGPGTLGPDDVAAGRAYAITPSVEGHGRISPATTQYLPAGRAIEFNLIPDTGYAVARVEVDGAAQDWSGAKYLFAGADGGSQHTVKVTFAATPLAGTNSPAGTVKRALGSMTSLASTGDGASALLIGAAGAVCAALGVALLTRNRRRKERPCPL